jgi:hypothetical protein
VPNQPQVDPVRNIGKRVKEIGKEHDLRLVHFSLVPAFEDGANDKLTMVFEYDPDGVTKPEIIVTRADEGLREAMEQSMREEQDRKADKAREELTDLEKKLRGGGGFL